MVSPLAQHFDWWAVDYMNTPGLGSDNAFESWARHFNLKVQQRFPEGPRILVGYSLGGRLALQALKLSSSLYDKAVFVSTNPGLVREKDKEERRLADLKWAQKFRDLPWDSVLREWNNQPVFKSGFEEPLRLEANYQRHYLAQALTEWSLAKQEDFRLLVKELSSKILWVSGEKDIKFASLAMELKRGAPELQSEIFTKSSHRVLFDQPGELARVMISFIQKGLAK